jgi:hypothetical protein
MLIAMPFEVFDKRRMRQPSACRVTIQKRGVFTLNHAAYTVLGHPEAVVFLFDEAHQRVGLKAAELSQPAAYAVRHNQKKTNHLVSGGLFTQHYGIPVDQARRFRARMEGDILCFDLAEAEAHLGS